MNDRLPCARNGGIPCDWGNGYLPAASECGPSAMTIRVTNLRVKARKLQQLKITRDQNSLR